MLYGMLKNQQKILVSHLYFLKTYKPFLPTNYFKKHQLCYSDLNINLVKQVHTTFNVCTIKKKIITNNIKKINKNKFL